MENDRNCELCGKISKLVKADIEGVILEVCSSCSGHGNIIKEASRENTFRKISDSRPMKELSSSEILVESHSRLIKDCREKKAITQKELAEKLNERLSIIQKVESGSIIPNFSLARKIERFFNIRLIEEAKTELPVKNKKDSGVFTIGDLLKK